MKQIYFPYHALLTALKHLQCSFIFLLDMTEFKNRKIYSITLTFKTILYMALNIISPNLTTEMW